MIAWLVRHPALVIGGALAVLLSGALLKESWNHQNTAMELARVSTVLANEREQNAETALKRARAYESALEASLAERTRLAGQAEDLRAARNTLSEARKSEQIDADRRIAALEAENAELRTWGDAVVPDDSVDWMLEPGTADATGAGDSRP